MSRARNLADLLDSNGDVVSGALDNVPASNDASALTTGTLPIARIADGDITAAKLGSTLDLSGKTVTLAAGGTGYGKVLQVVENRSTSGSIRNDSYNGTYVSTPYTATITPSSTSSKILVSMSFSVLTRDNGSSAALGFALARNGTRLNSSDANPHELFNSAGVLVGNRQHYQYLDSPSSTSATTYLLQAYFRNYSGQVIEFDSRGSTWSVVLMEIAG